MTSAMRPWQSLPGLFTGLLVGYGGCWRSGFQGFVACVVSATSLNLWLGGQFYMMGLFRTMALERMIHDTDAGPTLAEGSWHLAPTSA